MFARIFLLTFFTSQLLWAQDIKLKREINWLNNGDMNLFRPDSARSSEKNEFFMFDGAVVENPETRLPWYNEMIDLPMVGHNALVTLEEVVYTIMGPNETEHVEYLDAIPSELSLSVTPLHIDHKPVIRLSLLPLRRIPETDSIQRVVSFTVNVQPGQTLHKSAHAAKTTGLFATSSVLSTGDWFKVKVEQSGIYKLTYNDLVNLGISNPAHVRIYGNGGRQLPYMNSQPILDDLTENAIFMETGADGLFNAGDYILFYAEGVVNWNYNASKGMFIQHIHDYSTHVYYYLTSSFGPGKRILPAEQVTAPPDLIIEDYMDYAFYENNSLNLVKSGQKWVGEPLHFGPFETTFTFPGLLKTRPVSIEAAMVGRSSVSTSHFVIKVNNINLGTAPVGSVRLNVLEDTYARETIVRQDFLSGSENLKVNIAYNRSTDTDNGWLDYITFNAPQTLNLSGNALFFRERTSVAPGLTAEFRLTGADEKTVVWDITDKSNIKQSISTITGSTLSFIADHSTLRQYVALRTVAPFPTPTIDPKNKMVPNQDLHAVKPHQLIIVTPPQFVEQAEQLAQFRRTNDGLSVYIARTDLIYNEFSSGARDASAIRNFVRMVYQRSAGHPDGLRYLLLLGDGSYNNRLDHPDNPNFIPTYQSELSLGHTHSYVSDDFYGFLGDNEGGSPSMNHYILDIGIGRFPVKDTAEAGAAVRKIISYKNEQSKFDWRNTFLFLADDEDNNTHMLQANSLADKLMKNHPQLVTRKILLDAYKQVATSSGTRYPDAHKAIIDNFKRGILLFNYTGHGGINGITAELVLTRQDLRALTNRFYPLFVTATCEFSRFDYLALNEDGSYTDQTTAGEQAFLNPNGGAIALFTTTRVVFSGSNQELNNRFYEVLFNRDDQGNRYRLGDIVRNAKILMGSDNNKLNFVLLGDPSLTLAYPEYRVVTDSINGASTISMADTLNAFSSVVVSGRVVDHDSVTMSGFNGIIFPTVFDKKRMVTTLANDGGKKMEFSMQEDQLFKGKATVKNGFFSFEFKVPKDISYSIGQGKITYYAQNSVTDANGYFDGFNIGGTAPLFTPDNHGPEINLYINDENFANGGITDKNPIIYAQVWDESGINTTGNGIGHDITGVLNNDIFNLIVLNQYYQAKIDDYRAGEIVYPMVNLPAGRHSLTVKVWDIFNNSSEASIDFVVLETTKPVIENLYNYPNPAGSQTTFQFEHNLAGIAIDITLEVYDLNGRLLHVIKESGVASGYRTEPLIWDLTGLNGVPLANGIYPYRVKVKTPDGQVADKYGRLAVFK